jgi:FkbM family methyltransferase
MARQFFKRILRRYGLDVVTHRPFLELLQPWGIKCLLDVGANTGQFGQELRRAGYTGTIYSFEPTKQAFAHLLNTTGADERWHAENIGFGSVSQSRQVAVASDSQLTSMLDPLRPHPFSGSEMIRLSRLDEWLGGAEIELPRTCLKLDVQGYEKEIFSGAGQFLPQFAAVISELAICPTYEGQPYAEDVVAFLRAHGFDLWATRRGTWTPNGKREIERDGLFLNRATAACEP